MPNCLPTGFDPKLMMCGIDHLNETFPYKYNLTLSDFNWELESTKPKNSRYRHKLEVDGILKLSTQDGQIFNMDIEDVQLVTADAESELHIKGRVPSLFLETMNRLYDNFCCVEEITSELINSLVNLNLEYPDAKIYEISLNPISEDHTISISLVTNNFMREQINKAQKDNCMNKYMFLKLPNDEQTYYFLLRDIKVVINSPHIITASIIGSREDLNKLNAVTSKNGEGITITVGSTKYTGLALASVKTERTNPSGYANIIFICDKEFDKPNQFLTEGEYSCEDARTASHMSGCYYDLTSSTSEINLGDILELYIADRALIEVKLIKSEVISTDVELMTRSKIERLKYTVAMPNDVYQQIEQLLFTRQFSNIQVTYPMHTRIISIDRDNSASQDNIILTILTPKPRED